MTTYNPTEHLTCAETAKLVRAALKAEFPGMRFTVRSKTYTGASISVRWTDGPFDADVRRICRLYEGATFDSMQDLKSYRSSILTRQDGTTREVHFGADWVFTQRELSTTYREQLRRVASERAGRELPGDGTLYLDQWQCWDNQQMHRLSCEIEPQ